MLKGAERFCSAPLRLNVDLFGDSQCVINLNAEISDRTLRL